MTIINSGAMTLTAPKKVQTPETFLNDFLPHITPNMVRNILESNNITDAEADALYAQHQEDLAKIKAENKEKKQDETQEL